jgi:hypothetical protein
MINIFSEILVTIEDFGVVRTDNGNTCEHVRNTNHQAIISINLSSIPMAEVSIRMASEHWI